MDWTMETVYLGCAAGGGTVLVLQTLMLVLGGDSGHGDVHGDIHDAGGHGHAESAFNLLSLRAGAAFLTFFGLAGWGGTEAGWGTFPTMAAAFGAGLVMLVLVAWLMSLYRKIYSEGNIDPRNAVGRAARVYLRVPEKGSGLGKITVSIQGRTAEFQATSTGVALPTGSEVRVLRQTTENTFEVEPLETRSSP